VVRRRRPLTTDLHAPTDLHDTTILHAATDLHDKSDLQAASSS